MHQCQRTGDEVYISFPPGSLRSRFANSFARLSSIGLRAESSLNEVEKSRLKPGLRTGRADEVIHAKIRGERYSDFSIANKCDLFEMNMTPLATMGVL